MRFTIAIAALIFLISAASQTAGAQAELQTQSHVFEQLFPNPTGQNGIEDIVRACDILKNSAAYRSTEGAGNDFNTLTLSEKRQFLADPGVQSAFNLFHAGLKKQVRSPHEKLDDETLLPEVALYRMLARAVTVQIYVDFADGKVTQAITDFADLLRFSYIIHTDTLINGLVAIAIDAIALKIVTERLDQLSARDCERLIAIVNDWLKSPDPGIAILSRERIMTMSLLDKYRGQPAKLVNLLDPGKPGSPSRAKYEDLSAKLTNASASAVGPLFDEVGRRVNAYYDQVDARLQKPIWERTDIQEPADDGSIVSQLLSSVLPTISRVMDRYGMEQAKVQLLGVHAAIRRYRWENNRLPTTLEELKLGRMGVDPFSGKPFAYKRTDDMTYDLYSIGAPDRGNGDTPGSGARVPIR